MSVAVLFQNEPLVSQFVCDSQNFFGYETRRVGGNIHEDYSMLTERDIEKRHKIDMVCGNIKGNANSTYTFVAGRSTSKLYGKSSEQNKTAKMKRYQRDDIGKQLSRAFLIS